jgi:[acyl-carrier-protein] S-malonyltransferase
MASIAYIFPGQGSQYPGMGKELAQNFPVARKLFEEADDALGVFISRLCFDGPADQLQLTENTQPAILTTSVAALRVIETEGFPRPAYVAGHSLGEYSALVAARSLSLAEAVCTVRARGRYMQEAVPVGTGAMAAVLGASLEVIEKACAEASAGEVCAPANINSPHQIVIAGNTAAIDRAMELLRDAGARKVVKLNVSAPFHCALMKPAQERLEVDLAEIEFRDLDVPLVTNVDAAAIKGGNEARDALVKQVSAPVRWQEAIELMIREGVETFVELGPGKVLSGLARHINRASKCFNVEDLASFRAANSNLAKSDKL